MQFDLHSNPDPRSRKRFPMVLELQSKFAELGPVLVVAYLATSADSKASRLMPNIAFAGESYRVLIPSITNIPARLMKRPVGSVDSERDRILAALDLLFFGL